MSFSQDLVGFSFTITLVVNEKPLNLDKTTSIVLSVVILISTIAHEKKY